MGVQKQIWQNTIIEEFFPDDSFASKATNDSQYVNQGKTVHIPNAGKPSGVVKNRANLPAEVKVRTDVDVQYDLEEFTTDPVRIPHAETVELSYSKRNSVLKQDKEELRSKAHQSILEKWAPTQAYRVTTSGEARDAYITEATGKRKAITTKDVLALATKFDLQNIPADNRYLLLDAVMYADILADMVESQKIGFFAQADAKKGIVGELYGFKVMKRSTVLRISSDGSIVKTSEGAKIAATDVAAGLAFHSDAVSVAMGEVVMFDSVSNPTYYGDIYSFLIRTGGAKRRNDNKGIFAIVEAVVEAVAE